MNKSTLKKEGAKWVDKSIISEKQLADILSIYEKKDKSYLLILFAVLLLSIGILLFAFSDLAQVPNLARMITMIVTMVLCYVVGNHFFHQHLQTSHASSSNSIARRQMIYGVSFLILGYIFFGATLWLTLTMYHVHILNGWPFVLWSLVGLFIYVIYQHPLLFIIGLGVTVIGQIFTGLTFSSFNFLLFAMIIIGYFYYAYQRNRYLLSYLFAIGLSIQMMVAMSVYADHYYWFIFYVLLIYGLGEIVQKSTLKNALAMVSLLTIFIFKVYESFAIQESTFVRNIAYEGWFFVIVGIILAAIALRKWFHHQKLELMDLLLFVPLFYLPYAYLFIILSMFVFSAFWLVIGFQRQREDRIFLGMMTFMISILTVYIQYAWDTLNKSLFFLIGGLLLFFLSYLLEQKRREGEDK